MKKILTLLLCVLLAAFPLLAAGCFQTENSGVENSSTSSGGESSDKNEGEEEEGYFTVSLNMKSEGYTLKDLDLDTMKAIWTDRSNANVYSASFDRKGEAYSKEADGEYRVTLSGLPEKFTYDPNDYLPTNQNKKVTIDIYEAQEKPWGVVDVGLESGSPQLSVTGAYRFVFTNSSQRYYFRWYYPAMNAKMVIKSLVDVTENQVQPILRRYADPVSNPQNLVEEIRSGGMYSTYTKNFRYEINLNDSNQIGFGVGIEVQPGTPFPVTLDVLIDTEAYELDGAGLTQVPVVDPVIPDELREGEGANWRSILPEGEFTSLSSLYLSDEGIIFSASITYDENDTQIKQTKPRFHEDMVVLDPLNGVYYLNKNYSARPVDGKKLPAEPWRKYPIYTRLTKDVEDTQENWIPAVTPYRGESIGISQKANYFCTEFGRDYTAFIAKYFARVNDDGSFPTTQSLQPFLHEYSITTTRFKDGYGVAELGYEVGDVGVFSSEGGRWLWICGVYKVV